MRIKDFTIRAKLQIGIGVLIFILFCFAVFMLFTVNNFKNLLDDLKETSDNIYMVNEIGLESLSEVEFLKHYLVEPRLEFIGIVEDKRDTINKTIYNLTLTVENELVVNSLNKVKELHAQRVIIGDQILSVLDGAIDNESVGSQGVLALIIKLDQLSDDIAYELNKISEVNSVDRLKLLQVMDDSFRLNGITSVSLILMVAMALVAISYILINTISYPLKKLKIGAEELAKGNFEYDIDVKSNDELGVLAKSFDYMRLQLSGLYGGLEEKVEERTKTLNKTVKELKSTKESLIKTLEVLEQKQTNIEEQKARLEAILFSVGEGLVFIDLNLKVVFGNDVVENILGYKPKDYLNKKWNEVVRPSYKNGDLIEYDDLPLFKLSKPDSDHMIFVNLSDDHYYVSKSGDLVPVTIVVSKVMIDHNLAGYILVFKDVTEEKEIDKVKTEFVSLASHQLRTPLTSISWNTEMLLNEEVGELSEEQKVYLGEIYYGSQRMINLVNSLLNTSRVDLGNFMIEPTMMDVVKYTESLIGELKPAFEHRNIEVVSKIEPFDNLMMDEKLYHIILENLLTNALKYTPEGGNVELNLSKNGADIALSVKDNGYGIPEDQKDKIFSKLFRADNVKAMDTDGTGLGLYLVKSVLDYIGGNVWFETAEGKGTTFYVLIPTDGLMAQKGKSLNVKKS